MRCHFHTYREERIQLLIVHISSWCIVLWWQELICALIHIDTILCTRLFWFLNITNNKIHTNNCWKHGFIQSKACSFSYQMVSIGKQLIYFALLTTCFHYNYWSKKRMGNSIYARWIFDLSKRFWLLTNERSVIGQTCYWVKTPLGYEAFGLQRLWGTPFPI